MSEQDLRELHEACSALYGLTARILRVPDESEQLERMKSLSEETVEKSRHLLYTAAKIAEGAPERAREIYSLTDIASAAVFNAVSVVSTSAKVNALQSAIHSLKKTDSVN